MYIYNVQITGSGDTTISQWDIVRGESVASYKSHTGSVKTVDVKMDEPSECIKITIMVPFSGTVLTCGNFLQFVGKAKYLPQ